MTWEILAALITLAGALGGFAKTIANNTRAMTELRCTVKTLHEASKEQRIELNATRAELTTLHTRVSALEDHVRNRTTEQKGA